MKVGILECDSIPDSLQNDFDDYPGMFIKSFKLVSTDLEFEVYDVTKNHMPADINECDAYITTGSCASANDDDSWITDLEDFIRDCKEQNKKVVGICFGHQLLAKALGGKVEPNNIGWIIGVIENRVLQKQIWMDPELPVFKMIISHEDQVTRLGEGSELIASNDYCKNFMFKHGNNMLGIQGHPEFNKSYCRGLMKDKSEQIPDERLEEGYESLSRDPDNSILIHWIINFFYET